MKNEVTVEVPIAWFIRLKDYTEKLRLGEKEPRFLERLNVLLGYLESADILTQSK